MLGADPTVWTPFHHPIGRQPLSPHAPTQGPLRHLVAANILEGRFIRRAPEEDREILDEANVGVLGRRLELADCHVFDHAPAQRAYGRVGHRVLLSDLRWLTPSSSDRTTLPENPQRTQPLNRSRA